MKNKVRFYREQKYLTQGELGAMIGVQAQTIGNIENSKHKPRLKTVRALAQALDVTPQELFAEEETAIPAA